jgi:RNA polymerase sigma-70 factor (ECF subfamily)
MLPGPQPAPGRETGRAAGARALSVSRGLADGPWPGRSAEDAVGAWRAAARSGAIKERRHASWVGVRDVDGDHRAFLDATLPYLDVVYQIARHAARDGQEPEDLVQETYLRAYAGFGSCRGENMRAWLAAICLNAARSEGRRRRRRPWEQPAGALLDGLVVVRAADGDAAPDVADVVIAGLDAQAVSRCLAQLPEPQRQCIVLMDVAGYTARETAEVLGCPRGTVLARVHRGRRRLARLLAEAGVSHGQP